MNEVALVHLPHPHPARQRRRDVGVIDLGLRAFDGRVVRFHRGHELIDREFLRVVGLLIEHFLVDEVFVALEHDLSVGEQRNVLRFLGDGLIEHCLIGTHVNLGEEVAHFHVLPLGEGDFFQLAVHPGLDGDGVESLHGAQAVEKDRHVFALHRACHHGHRLIGVEPAAPSAASTMSARAAVPGSRRGSRAVRFVPLLPEMPPRPEDEDCSQNDDPDSFAHAICERFDAEKRKVFGVWSGFPTLGMLSAGRMWRCLEHPSRVRFSRRYLHHHRVEIFFGPVANCRTKATNPDIPCARSRVNMLKHGTHSRGGR